NAEQAKKKQEQLSESDMLSIIDRCGVDAFRYYLMSDIVTGKDADFSEERLVERYNADLANTLGNLLNRALNMAHKYRDGQLKKIPFQDLADDVNRGYKKLVMDYEAAWVCSSPDRAIGAVIDVARF